MSYALLETSGDPEYGVWWVLVLQRQARLWLRVPNALTSCNAIPHVVRGTGTNRHDHDLGLDVLG
jgi:hypothetical protein